MNNNFNHIGFSLLGNKLKLVEVLYNNNDYRIENINEVFFDDFLDFENDKETKILTILQSSFDELVLRNNIKSKNASFALPAELFYTMQIPYDNTLKQDDLENELKWEMSLVYPDIDIKDILIQSIECEKNSVSDVNTIIVFGIRRKYIAILNSFCSRNGLNLKYVDNLHIASDNSLFINKPEIKDNLVLSVFLIDKKISFTVYLKKRILFFKQVQLPALSNLTDVLLEELYNKKPFSINSNIIDFAFISGDELTKSKVNIINEKTNLNFSLFNPFGKILPSDSITGNPSFTENNNNFSSAAGMAYRIQ